MSDPTRPDRDAATPTSPEGARPGADPAARPEQAEPNGPLEGLVTASAAEAAEEAADLRGDHDSEAEALLARMGVEDEGIEAGQLLGLILAVLLSVAALAVVLIYLFIIPFRTQTGRSAEAAAQNYEQKDLRAEATARLGLYGREGETYQLPIGRAQALVAASYGAGAAGGTALPEGRQDWNVSFGDYTAEGAVQATPDGVDPTVYRFSADGVEEVGVDRETGETVDLIENDAELDADDAVAAPVPLEPLN